MFGLPWHDYWFVGAVVGIVICLAFFFWPRTIDKVGSLIWVGTRIVEPIVCKSHDSARIECRLSGPLEFYGDQLQELVRDRIRRLTADQIRSQNKNALKALNDEIRRFLDDQWNGKSPWKFKVTRVEVVHKLSPFPIGTQ